MSQAYSFRIPYKYSIGGEYCSEHVFTVDPMGEVTFIEYKEWEGRKAGHPEIHIPKEQPMEAMPWHPALLPCLERYIRMFKGYKGPGMFTRQKVMAYTRLAVNPLNLDLVYDSEKEDRHIKAGIAVLIKKLMRNLLDTVGRKGKRKTGKATKVRKPRYETGVPGGSIYDDYSNFKYDFHRLDGADDPDYDLKLWCPECHTQHRDYRTALKHWHRDILANRKPIIEPRRCQGMRAQQFLKHMIIKYGIEAGEAETMRQEAEAILTLVKGGA